MWFFIHSYVSLHLFFLFLFWQPEKVCFICGKKCTCICSRCGNIYLPFLDLILSSSHLTLFFSFSFSFWIIRGCRLLLQRLSTTALGTRSWWPQKTMQFQESTRQSLHLRTGGYHVPDITILCHRLSGRSRSTPRSSCWWRLWFRSRIVEVSIVVVRCVVIR